MKDYMILIEILRPSIRSRVFNVIVSGQAEAFEMAMILESSASVLGFKFFLEGFQVRDLHSTFGWGRFEKFCPGQFTHST